jgi:hypothetical protein
MAVGDCHDYFAVFRIFGDKIFLIAKNQLHQSSCGDNSLVFYSFVLSSFRCWIFDFAYTTQIHEQKMGKNNL